MAYICLKGTKNKKFKCKGCPHYRFDEDYGDFACWAQHDEKTLTNQNGQKAVK